MQIDDIRTEPLSLLREWLDDYTRSGLFQSPDCPYNYYEVQAEYNRRKELRPC